MINFKTQGDLIANLRTSQMNNVVLNIACNCAVENFNNLADPIEIDVNNHLYSVTVNPFKEGDDN